MYTLELITEIITRDSDNVQIIPAQDPGAADVQAYYAWVALGNQPTRYADLSAFQAYVADVVQKKLDTAAKDHGYDSILSAVSYKDSSVPAFSADATAFLAWRDGVWAYCYTLLAECQVGAVPVPTVSELLAGLPPLIL